MIDAADMELVGQYARSRSEEAFTTLVARHLNLVYSVALRHVRDAHQAQDICQAVFLILARKAGTLSRGTVLSGWLYETARLTAANYVRAQIRRSCREKEAQMQSLTDQPEPDVWGQVAPMLDLAVADLNERDRNAVVLRFFEARNFQEVGSALGTTEDAAKMRVNRAVEKLRKFFMRRGVSLSAAALCTAVSAHSVQAAPAALVASVSAAALKGSTTTISTLALIKTTLQVMAWTKAKTTVVIGAGMLLAAGTATVTVKEVVAHRTYPWQVRSMNTDILRRVPPQVRIVESRFPDSGGWGAADDKVMGIGQSLETILLVAYNETSPSRLILPDKLPEGRYDFIANLPRNSREALRRELKRKFGLSATHQQREIDVLHLTVKNPGGDGLRPSKSQGGSARSSAGEFSCVNQPLSSLVSMLENQLKVPVVDETGLQGGYDIDLAWEQTDFQHPAPDALKQALLEQLGLELKPSKTPVPMLLVQKDR